MQIYPQKEIYSSHGGFFVQQIHRVLFVRMEIV